MTFVGAQRKLVFEIQGNEETMWIFTDSTIHHQIPDALAFVQGCAGIHSVHETERKKINEGRESNILAPQLYYITPLGKVKTGSELMHLNWFGNL